MYDVYLSQGSLKLELIIYMDIVDTFLAFFVEPNLRSGGGGSDLPQNISPAGKPG